MPWSLTGSTGRVSERRRAVLVAVVVAGLIGFGALALAYSHDPRRARVWLWSLTVFLGLAVGLSRIALDVHDVTDVLAGWCLGLAWLAGCLLVRDGLRPRARSAQ